MSSGNRWQHMPSTVYRSIWFMGLFVILQLAGAFGESAFACNDVLLKAKDGYVHGRSMEFHVPLMVSQRQVKRDTLFTTKGSDGKPGLTWTSKYAYVGLASNVMAPFDILDGVNEEGLSLGALWLNVTRFPHSGIGTNAIASTRLASFLLGTCKNVAEVKAALGKIRLWGERIPALRSIPSVHLACADASGGYIVVEFIQGAIKVYDNPLHALTNDPEFPTIRSQVTAGKPVGGSARRLAALTRLAGKTFASRQEGIKTVTAFFQARQKAFSFGKTYSQWYVVKDLKERKLYFYEGTSLRWSVGPPV